MYLNISPGKYGLSNSKLAIFPTPSPNTFPDNFSIVFPSGVVNFTIIFVPNFFSNSGGKLKDTRLCPFAKVKFWLLNVLFFNNFTTLANSSPV